MYKEMNSFFNVLQLEQYVDHLIILVRYRMLFQRVYLSMHHLLVLVTNLILFGDFVGLEKMNPYNPIDLKNEIE
jgi:hypothetical protein